MSVFPLGLLATRSLALVVDEEAGELLQAPAHPRLGGIDNRWNTLVHGLRNEDVAGNQRVCLHLQSSLDLADVELYLRIRPIEHQLELAHGNVQQPEGLEAELDVLNVRNVHSGDEEDVVTLLEQRQHHVVEVGRRVDDDVGAEGLQELDDAEHVGAAYLVGEGGLDRRREDVEPGRLVAHEQALEELGVEAVDGRHGVDDRVLGRQLHHDRDVAELEVGVDEHDRSVGLPGKDDGEVGRHHRFARSTLGGEDADEPALLTRALGFDRRARDNRQRLGGSFDGFDELATVGGRRYHVANASPERLLQHLGGQLLDHHDRS